MTVLLRAALYLRLSTARQAEHDVSIPDQKRQGEAYCHSRGYQLVETYVEPGASAANDRRFDAAQAHLGSRNPKVTPARVVAGHRAGRASPDRSLIERFDAKPAEIRQLLRGDLDPARSRELLDKMRAAGLPTRCVSDIVHREAIIIPPRRRPFRARQQRHSVIGISPRSKSSAAWAGSVVRATTAGAWSKPRCIATRPWSAAGVTPGLCPISGPRQKSGAPRSTG